MTRTVDLQNLRERLKWAEIEGRNCLLEREELREMVERLETAEALCEAVAAKRRSLEQNGYAYSDDEDEKLEAWRKARG